LEISVEKATKKRQKPYDKWWLDRIKTISGFQNEAVRLYQTTQAVYPVRAWAVLKLALVAFYIDLYTSIVKARFPSTAYIDLFAGPGLNQIEETGDIVFGSPLLADRVPKSSKKFDHLLLVEKDLGRSSALRSLLPLATVIPDDVNGKGIERILELADASVPSLVFVDPEGLTIHWNTLEKILGRWCDLVINYQPTSVRRIVGSYRSNRAYEQSLNDFFGSDRWKGCQTEEDLLRLYVQGLEMHREVVIPIKVQSPEAFYYYIIIAVRRTAGSQEWIEAIHRARKKIEQATSEDAKRFLDIYMGRQATIDGL